MEKDDSGTDRRHPLDSAALSPILLIERINQCPKLASLKSINETLRDLLDSDVSFVAQMEVKDSILLDHAFSIWSIRSFRKQGRKKDFLRGEAFSLD